MAHFVQPPGTPADGYDADGRLAPDSLWRVRVPLGGTRTVALWGGAGLRVTSNNSAVVPQQRLRELPPAGDLRVFELFGASAGGSFVEVRGPDGAFWIQLQASVADSAADSGAPEAGLMGRTNDLVTMFDAAIAKYRSTEDVRAFFTMAHGYITRKIRKHIGLFAAPNPLLRLNDSFATTFLAAVNGTPHDGWQRAFRACAGLSSLEDRHYFGIVSTKYQAGPSYELCASCMAKIHISRDLKEALKAVKGVSAQDYGNVLIFVNEGHLYAETQIRGRARGAVFVAFGVPIANSLNMSAKLWRNQAFQEAYGLEVPDPSDAFVAAYHKAEGRQ